MSEEFKDFTATPTLTLDPFQDKAAPVLQQETALKPEEAGWDDSMLTVEEKQMVDCVLINSENVDQLENFAYHGN